MNKIIHEYVVEAINNSNYDFFEKNQKINTKEDQYRYNSACRLIKVWKKYNQDIKYQVDFECSLRNYLILMKTDIYINDYKPSQYFDDFKLQYDCNSGQIWVSTDMPTYINSKFIRDISLYDVKVEGSEKNDNIFTTPYIYELTGFNTFRSEEQKMAVMGSLKTPPGYTTLVSLSTGGGKSLITQTISYQQEGLTIVIVPTISLMIDQVKNAKQIINSNVEKEIFCYYTGQDIKPIIEAIKKKEARILFISPESIIKNRDINKILKSANNEKYLKNIVVDEAHIIVEWGSHFRTDFQCLDAIRNSFIKENPDLRTFLLSATYSNDTVSQLKSFYSQDSKWIEIRCDKLRHELRYDVIKASSFRDKQEKLIELIKLLPRPMIIYLRSPDDVESLKEELNKLGFNNVCTFTGKTPNKQREEIINKWKQDEFDLMIATCAFGIGVDKKDIRTVLHAYVPDNPNKYYQEAGRGGRDGLPSLSLLLYTDSDVDSAFTFLSKVITTEKLFGRWFSMINNDETKYLSDNRILINTNVKPGYNASDIYIDSINDQDITWNVYVILFLRRYNLITIDNVEYIGYKYIFEITLKNRSLLCGDEETNSCLDEIRNKEWKLNQSDFLLIKRNLSRVRVSCWSNMFNKIYPLTDEYCSGCNNHNEIIDLECGSMLKKHINQPVLSIDNVVNDYCYGAKCMLIIDKDYIHNKELYEVQQYIDVLVGSNDIIEDHRKNTKSCSIKKSLIYFDYNDFVKMNACYKYYVSGSVAIIFPDEVSIQKRILGIIENSRNTDVTYLVISKEDYYLEFRNKNLSEVITGPCKGKF